MKSLVLETMRSIPRSLGIVRPSISVPAETCQEQDVDRYGRTIATCRVRGARKEIEDMVRGKRIYIMTARRMISGEVLKYRNEFLIHGRYETRFTNSSKFCLTMPRYPNGVRARISGVKGQRPC
jgi:hypothetical protein